VAATSHHSIEHLIALLSDELVRRGHDVTLFATGDSETLAELHAEYPHGYDYDDDLWDWRFHEAVNTAAAYERAAQFDVIHSHVHEIALPFTQLVATPTVHTHHIDLDADIAQSYARFPRLHVIAPSRHHAGTLPDRCLAGIVHHGIDVDAFSFEPRGGEYLLFLGRMMPRKGPAEAIQVARATGMRLVLAGPSEEGYFERAVAPLLDGKQIEYVGRVKHDDRNRLLAGAAALLCPLQEPEPFGLVMIEAMACGTPVIAFNRGAVPELIEEGLTGFIVEDEAGAVQAVNRIGQLSRQRIRRRFEERFTAQRMANDYLAVYSELIDAAKPRPRLVEVFNAARKHLRSA
jgi:glycosyltransferase involved in cell wall biosynthesis